MLTYPWELSKILPIHNLKFHENQAQSIELINLWKLFIYRIFNEIETYLFTIMHGIETYLVKKSCMHRIETYIGTPFERPPWQEANPSGEATLQCKSKHKCIDFYPWREATRLEGPLFWCKRGVLTRGVPLYLVTKLLHGIDTYKVMQ